MDLADPATPSSLGGASYFREWKGVAEGQSQAKVLILRKDNGKEFTSAAFKSSMGLLGVQLQTTHPDDACSQPPAAAAPIVVVLLVQVAHPLPLQQSHAAC